MTNEERDLLPKETDGCIHDWQTAALVLFPLRIKYRCSKCKGYTYSLTRDEEKKLELAKF